jgi:methylase of polypeptide subunit release factors
MREQINFKAGGYRYPLLVDPENVFKPSPTTRIIIEGIDKDGGIVEGDTVIDMGCGVGPISAYSARCGAGNIIGADIMPEACKLAEENARINGYHEIIEIYCGSLFSPLREREVEPADKVIIDVSGTPRAYARISGFYPEPVATAGDRGAELYLEALPEAKEFVRSGGNVYFPVCIDRENVLKTASDNFSGTELVFEKHIPLPPQITPLFKNGEIAKYVHPDDVSKIQEMHGRPCFKLEIYRARK